MIWTLFFLFQFSYAHEETSLCIERNVSKASLEKTWEHPEWLGLLHMREGLFTPKSEADGPRFFIAKTGVTAKEELFATISAFCANETRTTDSDAIPQIQSRCQFPAREQWLKAKGFEGWPEPNCPNLETWKNRVGREKVSLVFSSYYANNPSSVFGHTLLRFDRVQNSGELYSPLLSYGINFAGDTTTSNPVLYALMGMMGGFKGKFASLPYYYKVREYSDFDSRDLWEYELDLSKDQIEMLLNHIWEQGFSYYDYFYFTENCSYHLLTSLDVAIPEHNLDQKVPYWVIPVDTVKALTLKSPGLVKDIRFRPSLYRQFLRRLERLEKRKLDTYFYAYLDHGSPSIQNLSESDQAYVLDTILDYWDFKNAKDLLEPTSTASVKKNEYLKARAALPVTESLHFNPLDYERPDESHETLRVGLSAGHDQLLGDQYEFDLRFALHDLIDPQRGYPSTAKIEFFRLTGSYFSEQDQFKFTDLKFFDVQLISPLKKLENSYSWRAQIGLNRSFIDCDYCLGSSVLMQGGGALGFFDDQAIVYGLVGADLRFSPEHDGSNLMALPLGTLGLRILGPKDFNFLIEQNYSVNSIYALPNSSVLSGELRKSLTLNWALGGRFQKEEFKGFENENYKFSLYHYF